MPDVLFDPEQKEMMPLRGVTKIHPGVTEQSSVGVVYALENKAHVRQCCSIIRGICARRGIPETDVPVIHRLKGRFRYWDIRQGEGGASNFCVILCGPEWRIATAEEQKEHNEKLTKLRAEAFERAKREASAKVIAESGIKQIIEASIHAPSSDPMPQQAANTKEKKAS